MNEEPKTADRDLERRQLEAERKYLEELRLRGANIVSRSVLPNGDIEIVYDIG